MASAPPPTRRAAIVHVGPVPPPRSPRPPHACATPARAPAAPAEEEDSEDPVLVAAVERLREVEAELCDVARKQTDADLQALRAGVRAELAADGKTGAALDACVEEEIGVFRSLMAEQEEELHEEATELQELLGAHGLYTAFYKSLEQDEQFSIAAYEGMPALRAAPRLGTDPAQVRVSVCMCSRDSVWLGMTAVPLVCSIAARVNCTAFNHGKRSP